MTRKQFVSTKIKELCYEIGHLQARLDYDFNISRYDIQITRNNINKKLDEIKKLESPLYRTLNGEEN